MFTMKSKKLNTSKLNWDSSILELSTNPKLPTKTIQSLYDHGFNRIRDLIWILPLRVQNIPEVENFSNIKTGLLFKGAGEIININLQPAFGKKGKNRVQLFNITVLVKDIHSDNFINLKWFNAYPSIKKQIEELDRVTFLGPVQVYNEAFQIINPSLNPKESPDKLLIDYPTVNKVSGNHIKTVIRKIPENVWQSKLNYYESSFEDFLNLAPMNKAFITLHGLNGKYIEDDYCQARDRLVYDEFIRDQLKVSARKMAFQSLSAQKISVKKKEIQDYISRFEYELTPDQFRVLEEVKSDLSSGHPMMRIIQGDVGCGKTTVAILAAAVLGKSKKQVAIMCPTEALARQHEKTFKDFFKKDFNIELLVGSTKSKEKKRILEDLSIGKIDFIIGTHSLFQEQVKFKDLQLSIIDEQHKFGVDQRLKLVNKGFNSHCLLMSATPIPRTLQLAQYGDLNISTIKSLPKNRKGTQTRIVSENTYEKYLSFVKTRVSIGEQAYIVVPAITESESMDLKNVDSHLKTYRSIFPDLRIQTLHGQLTTEEKSETLSLFEKGKIDLLIATSVIEVGINIINASVITIYDPERFGLSSLHQLRGRVGRGEKAGFCFLIPDKQASKDSLKRLKVIEKSNDGFVIAEADLKNRGEGDLFGTNQSGNINTRNIASIFEHFHIFEKVKEDIEKVKKQNPQLLQPLIDKFIQDKKISSTI